MPQIGIRAVGNPKIEMHVTASGDGDYFRRHRDTDRTGTRVVSFVYYFYRAPRRFSGGELRLRSRRAAGARLEKACRPVTLSPRLDSIIFFPSLTEHEVLRVRVPSRAFADGRFTITGWIHRRRT
jgi:Rps23 Pro-64 3,4-dihydroxylase Tpa1-like proline 4-hydroxylase